MHALSRSLMSIGLATLAIAGTSGAQAGRPTFTQTFDDVVEDVPCEGFSLGGVSYSYTLDGVPSLGCTVGPAGPTTNNVEPPLIQFGAGGVLRLQFDVPTTSFGFGIAQLSDQPLLQSVVVDIFSPGVGMLREELILDNFLDPQFAGGRFEYEGPAIRSATIRIANETSGRPVAIDNITYARPRSRRR